MKIKTVQERDERLKKLSTTQRDFLLHHVKRGKRTVFSNIIALQKGAVLADDLSLDEAEKTLEEWELVEVIDSGFVNDQTRCECGRPLRYQYIVQHKRTNKILKFGLNHFEEHMGLPANVVTEIRKQFMSIDYELDELLEKIENNVNHENLFLNWPEDLPIPKDIQEHLDANVPLLERQINRLQKLKSDYFRKQQNVIDEAKQQISYSAIPDEEFNLFNMEIVEETANKPIKINLNENNGQLEEIVYQLVNRGIYGVMDICHILINDFGIHSERYKTGRPKLIVQIVNILDKYVEQGEFIITEDSNIENRYYMPIKK